MGQSGLLEGTWRFREVKNYSEELSIVSSPLGPMAYMNLQEGVLSHLRWRPSDGLRSAL